MNTALESLERVYRKLGSEEAANITAYSRTSLGVHRTSWEQEIAKQEPDQLGRELAWLQPLEEMESDLDMIPLLISQKESLDKAPAQLGQSKTREKLENDWRKVERQYMEERRETLRALIAIWEKNLTDLELEIALHGDKVEVDLQIERATERLERQKAELQNLEVQLQGLSESENSNDVKLMPLPPNKQTTLIRIQLMHILHLSDLHFGTQGNAQLWYTQLAADLRRELNCTRLDAVILSGDIANKSTPEEYDAAKLFLNKLIAAFQLTSDRIIIVPGNHDLNWGLAQEAYSLTYRDRYQGELREGNYIPIKDKVIEVRDENKYKERFAHFSKFYQDIKGEPYPLEYEQQGILHYLGEQNLLILGLNSAWQLDHHYKSRASIHPIALSNALEKIDENYTIYEKCLKIAVWHHPLDSAFADRIVDRGFLEQLAVAGFRLFLHGHIHKAETSLFHYDLGTNGRKLDRVCAGTFGAPVHEWVSGYPLQYNLLKFEDNKLKVNTRRREELNVAWKPDARWLMGAGQNPLPYYEIPLFAK